MPEKNIKTKKHFTNQFKRRILLDYAKYKKPNEVFLKNGIDFTEDKKYALKLIHKWKKELYKNIKLLSLNFSNVNVQYANIEINDIGSDYELDDILDEILTKNNKK